MMKGSGWGQPPSAGIRLKPLLLPTGHHSNIPASVRQSQASISDLLDRLEKFYGPQEPSFPVDPYEFLVWWHCGYPASDAACTKGWKKLTQEVGIDPDKLLRAKPAKLAAALKVGGMVPELRAERLKEIAMRIENEFAGDLRAGLAVPLPDAQKRLKKFPGIADQEPTAFSYSLVSRQSRPCLRTAYTSLIASRREAKARTTQPAIVRRNDCLPTNFRKNSTSVRERICC